MSKRLHDIPDILLVLFVLVLLLAIYVGIYAAWGVWEPTVRDGVLGILGAFTAMLKMRAGQPPPQVSTPAVES